MTFAQVQLARDKQEGSYNCYYNYEFGILKGSGQNLTFDLPEDQTGRQGRDRKGLVVPKHEVKVIVKLPKRIS